MAPSGDLPGFLQGVHLYRWWTPYWPLGRANSKRVGRTLTLQLAPEIINIDPYAAEQYFRGRGRPFSFTFKSASPVRRSQACAVRELVPWFREFRVCKKLVQSEDQCVELLSEAEPPEPFIHKSLINKEIYRFRKNLQTEQPVNSRLSTGARRIASRPHPVRSWIASVP